MVEIDAENPRIDWTFWAQDQFVTPRQAMLLSMNIDPDPDDSPHWDEVLDQSIDLLWPERCELVARDGAIWASTNQPSNPLRIDHWVNGTPWFPLSTFVQWAQRKGWKLPPRLLEAYSGGRATTKFYEALRTIATEYPTRSRVKQIVSAVNEQLQLSISEQTVRNLLKLPDADEGGRPERDADRSRTAWIAFAAIAADRFGWQPKAKRSESTARIADHIRSAGRSIETDTVRAWLKRSKAEVERARHALSQRPASPWVGTQSPPPGARPRMRKKSH